MAQMDDRKKRIMEHLARTKSQFTLSSAASNERKQRILDHVRRTSSNG